MHLINKILYIFKNNSSKNYSNIPKDIIKSFNKTRPLISRKYICNAPFRNLYFNSNGQVSVCCYNMNYMVGDIKENTISEIWNSEKIKKLRNYITNNDLSLGCDTCKSDLLLENYENLHIKYFDEHFKSDNFPTSLMFQIDNTCNLECTMCTGDFSSSILKNREHRGFLSNPYTEKFFNELNLFLPNIKMSMFSGGEPFLINSYFEIWNKIIETNPDCLIVVQTNGTILNKKVKNILTKGNFQIGISLDSLNLENYKNIRVNSELDTVLNNINYFKKYNNLHNHNTGLSVCVLKQNRYEIPDISKFCSENELNIVYNTIKFPAKNAVWILKSSEINSLIEFYNKCELPNETITQKKNKIKFNDLIKKLKFWYKVSLKWENYKPTEYNKEQINNIQQKVIEKIKDSANSFFDSEIVKISLISKIELILNEIPNNDLKLITLQNINKYSGNKILANIYREDDESLKLLIHNFAKFTEMNL